MGNGLDGIDLVRVWVAWRVIPLSRRPGLMCTYSGEKDDPLRHSPDNLLDDAVEATTQSLLKEGTVTSNAFGLLPFCKKNPAPPVSYYPPQLSLLCYTLPLLITLYPYS